MDETTNNQTSMDATNANPNETITETTDQTVDNGTTQPEIDYKTKFSESSKEALRLRDETIRLANELELARKQSEQTQGATYSNNSEQSIPGFEHMSEDEQKNLLAYTDFITTKTAERIYSDPVIAEAKKKYNESVWLNKFDEISDKYPDLKGYKDDFKNEFFNPDSNPSNLSEILERGAKVFLFDKSADIGAKKALEQAERIDIERSGGGDKAPTQERTSEDWERLRISNPVKFAQEYRKSQQK